MFGALIFGLLQATPAQLPTATVEDPQVLAPITVRAERVANLQPASSFAATASALRYDPLVDLQSRGLPEGQADITIRGGLFENTGFRLGAVTVFDPQTGHYSVEIPIDPAMLGNPQLTLDFENGLHAFNASIATVSYGFADVRSGGSLAAGFGTDSLRYGVLRAGHASTLENGRTLGVAASAAASRGDGTEPFGDHDFKRVSGQVQLTGQGSETNLLFGYHDKFYGWPGAYTGFASLPETDHTKLGLLLADHRRASERGWWEIGAAYRWLDDDYDFDRRTIESGVPGSFEHETRSFSLGLSGEQSVGGLDWSFSALLAADRLVRSTDLTFGDFNSRRYLSLSLAPGREWSLRSGSALTVRAGIRTDFSNRDESAVLPLFGLTFETATNGGVNRFSLEYSQNSQVPGYTALNSRPTGLFGGNPDLGREYANTLSVGLARETARWQLTAAVFHRRDRDLVDWTFREGAPFLRQANPVDIKVLGLEAFAAWHGARLRVIGGFTWLDKDADYGAADVDASYYALNFARERLTLALVYQPLAGLEVRWDSEYRRQQANSLRSSGDKAFLTSLSASWTIPLRTDFRLLLVADNLTDSDFQEFPGTPPPGRQISLGLGLGW
jgi:hypothetical protein